MSGAVKGSAPKPARTAARSTETSAEAAPAIAGGPTLGGEPTAGVVIDTKPLTDRIEELLSANGQLQKDLAEALSSADSAKIVHTTTVASLETEIARLKELLDAARSAAPTPEPVIQLSEADITGPALRVTSSQPGRRRAGHSFGREPVFFLPDDIEALKVLALIGDPALTVEMTKGDGEWVVINPDELPPSLVDEDD